MLATYDSYTAAPITSVSCSDVNFYYEKNPRLPTVMLLVPKVWADCFKPGTLTDSAADGANYCPPGNHNITITNFVNGDVSNHSLLLVKGRVTTKEASLCPCANDPFITLNNFGGPATIAPCTVWEVADTEFKCIVNLEPGINRFTFEYCSCNFELNVEFKPRQTPLRVTPVYIICEGHDGRFQAPEEEDNSIDSACERIAMGVRLIQCLFSEKLDEAGYGRRTFQLEHDLDSLAPECVVFYSKLAVEKAWTMAPSELWEYFGRELMTSPLSSDNRKFVAFISCTRYIGSPVGQRPTTHEDVLSLTDAHVALGGGGLALFGSACLHTWPCTVDEVVPRFLCSTRVDTTLLMDDSCYRGTYGACFSTTLGSVAHELGHTFDLGHTEDGIMGLGYSDVNKVFTIHSRSVGGNEGHRARRRARSLPQHATVSFTRDLNVTCTMSSPLRRPRGKITPSAATARKSMSQDESKTLKQVVKSFTTDSFDTQAFKCMDDLTFWAKSCAALLAFHRWFNTDVAQDLEGRLVFDEKKKAVSSVAGVRVVELRTDEGTVLKSWEFPELQGRRDFLLPCNAFDPPVAFVVAEDSVGNLVKQRITHNA